MRLFLLTIVLFLLATESSFSQIDISDARQQDIGATVTIQGIVTNGEELGSIRYMQDATGGLPIFPGSGSPADFSSSVGRGDLVELTGILSDFHGLLEMSPITSFNVISSGNPLPDPLLLTPNELSEANEALLVKIDGVTFDDGGSVFTGNNTYSFTVDAETAQIFVRSGNPLVGTPIPLATVNLTGLSGQFDANRQLIIRDLDDIEIADNFFITSAPVQSDITNEGFTISWATNVAASSNLRYGTTPDFGQEINFANSTTDHSITLTGLAPAEFYFVEVFSDNGVTTVTSNPGLYSTASNSTGEMRVYFNFDVDESFSTGTLPNGTTSAIIEATLIEMIDNAQTSIDFAMLNINRTTIVDALKNATGRGVQVRYIANSGSANTALSPSPPFPVVFGNTDALMHNKFMVIDVGSVDSCWVMMGSMNATSQNMANDPNNVLFIQDQALAKAYQLEFEEMWGSDGADPGIFTLKFGANKTNNTPHRFLINNIPVESYFSPSDNTTNAIIGAIGTADNDLEFAIFSFTQNDLGTAVRDANDAGVAVRGIIENTGDQGTEFDYLVSMGVNVTDHPPGASLHHKYAIIDGADPTSDPIVVTGSHNWSNSAETRNDENTLIIHDATIANLFIQEFEARWGEVVTGIEVVSRIPGFDVRLFPNPVITTAFLEFDAEEPVSLTTGIWDINGRLFRFVKKSIAKGESRQTLDLNGLPSGNYVLTVQLNDQLVAHRFSVVR